MMERLSLEDVRDVEAFVKKTLMRSGLRFGDSEREELEAEGLAIMVELHHRWDGRGRFSGYAAAYLPKRLTDAWHRLHREHSYATLPGGGRGWKYGVPPTSLDRITQARGSDAAAGIVNDRYEAVDGRGNLGAQPPLDPGEQVVTDVPAATYLGTPVHVLVEEDARLAGTVRQALKASLEDEVDLCLRVSLLAATGKTRGAICGELGLSEDELRAVFARLRRCAFLLDPNLRRAA